MMDKLQDILDTLPEKPPRSRLESYRELIDELRQRGWTYREIVGILADKCQLSVSISTLHDFVRLRSLGKRTSAKRAATDEGKTTSIEPKGGVVSSGQRAADDEEVRRRIAAFKDRKAATTPSRDDFHFDASQPLRLITPEKPASDK
jgi:IS30 family transposase